MVNKRIFIYDRLFVLDYDEAQLQIFYKIYNSALKSHLNNIKIYNLFRWIYF